VVQKTDRDLWFVREVLPLEAALSRFLKRHWRNESEISDLRQEVYVRVYEASRNGAPYYVRQFLFSTARNLMVDLLRREQVVSIETVSDLEALNVETEQIGPEREVIARDELKRLQVALESLPPRCREIVRLRKVQGMSQREVARQLGIVEDVVEHQVMKGIRLLATALYGEDRQTVRRQQRTRMKEGGRQ
jgi:RNA polymerase sigma factor (sigma-70 family)